DQPDDGRPRRFRLQDRRRPDYQQLPERSANQRLHPAIYLRRPRSGRRPRHGRRSEPHDVRHSGFRGGGFTWLQNYPDNYPQTPNKYPDFQNGESRTTWQFKASGTYDAPYEIRI